MLSRELEQERRNVAQQLEKVSETTKFLSVLITIKDVRYMIFAVRELNEPTSILYSAKNVCYD